MQENTKKLISYFCADWKQKYYLKIKRCYLLLRIKFAVIDKKNEHIIT